MANAVRHRRAPAIHRLTSPPRPTGELSTQQLSGILSAPSAVFVAHRRLACAESQSWTCRQKTGAPEGRPRSRAVRHETLVIPPPQPEPHTCIKSSTALGSRTTRNIEDLGTPAPFQSHHPTSWLYFAYSTWGACVHNRYDTD